MYKLNEISIKNTEPSLKKKISLVSIYNKPALYDVKNTDSGSLFMFVCTSQKYVQDFILNFCFLFQ